MPGDVTCHPPPLLCLTFLCIPSFVDAAGLPASNTHLGRHILSSWVLGSAPLPQEGLLDPQSRGHRLAECPAFLCSASHHYFKVDG